MGIATVSFQRKAERYLLTDLWFMVGSRCNLRCIHCYVDSSPENDSLEQLNLEEVKRYVDEAREFGLRSIYFTGGEPFLNEQIAEMIQYSLDLADVTILTNATSPLQRHIDSLVNFSRRYPDKLTLRVSLDHYSESRHDAIRGKGSFRKTVENTMELARRGVRTIITVTPEVYRGNAIDAAIMERQFQKLFSSSGVFIETKMLPAVIQTGAPQRRVDQLQQYEPVTEGMIEARSLSVDNLMCFSGRSVLKIKGRCRVYPCPLIYEVPDFDLGATLHESLSKRVALSHRACATYCCASREIGSCKN